MLGSLTDEDSRYMCQILCTLLRVGISIREPHTDTEFNSAMSELNELLVCITGSSLTEADHVLNAIFQFPEIERVFYKEAKPLVEGGSLFELASALSNVYWRSEDLLEFIMKNETADFYYMSHCY